MNLSTVFAKMTMLILIMLLGYLCARIGITGPEFNKRVTPLMVTVLLPATILNSVLGAPAFQAIEIVDYILVLTVMVALQMLPAWLLPRLLRTRGEDAGAMRLTTAFGNVGFVGLPVVAAIFGEEMVFFASLCNIPFNLALYSSCASQLSPEGGRVRWQDVLNAPVIATLLSIVLLGVGINGLNLIGAPSWAEFVYNGGVLIIAVFLSQLDRYKKKPRKTQLNPSALRSEA